MQVLVVVQILQTWKWNSGRCLENKANVLCFKARWECSEMKERNWNNPLVSLIRQYCVYCEVKRDRRFSRNRNQRMRLELSQLHSRSVAAAYCKDFLNYTAKTSLIYMAEQANDF